MALTAEDRRIVGLFGVPFDPLPSKEALFIKHACLQAQALANIAYPTYLDPCDFFLANLPQSISRKCLFLGKVLVPSWLQPKPQPADIGKLNVDSFGRFIKSGGCLAIANEVRDFIIKNVFPRIPGMIGVDHSSTYGAISALKEYYKNENLGLIVLDSHFDGVPMILRHGLIEYSKETNSPFIPHDLFSQNDYPSFSLSEAREWTKPNTENFLLHILKDKFIEPENLIVVGITDYPPKAFEKVDDSRMINYLNSFSRLEERGTSFIRKSDLRENGPKILEKALQNLKTSLVYISLDIDAGSLSSVYASRFLNTIGLSLDEIRGVFQSLFSFFSDGLKLVGFDLMEVDVHKLGAKIDDAHIDQTSKVGRMFLDLVAKIV